MDSIDFCNILGMIPDEEEGRKIVAVRSEENIKGELDKIRLLFACSIQTNDERGYVDSIAYIPVEIDFKEKIMILKAWTRQNIAQEEFKANNLLTHIQRLMKIEFNIVTEDFVTEHKRTLFLMSKSLINEAYAHVPTYTQIYNINGTVDEFVEKVLSGLPLRNKKMIGNKYILDGQLRQRVLQKKTEKQDCYERYIMEEADRNQYLAVKQACDAEIEAAEKKIAELSKEMAMQAEVSS